MKKFLFWFPRVFAIIFIAFLAIFALDVFDENSGFWGTISALFIHLIPNFIFIIALIIAWKKEKIGGWIFIALGLLLALWLVLSSKFSPFSVIVFGPPVIIGILFLFGSKYFKKSI